MLVKPEPLPWKEPENEPEKVPVPEEAKEAVPNREPVKLVAEIDPTVNLFVLALYLKSPSPPTATPVVAITLDISK